MLHVLRHFFAIFFLEHLPFFFFFAHFDSRYLPFLSLQLPLADWLPGARPELPEKVLPPPLGQTNWSDEHKFWPAVVRPTPLQTRVLPWILRHVLNTLAPLMSWSQAHIGTIGGGGGGDFFFFGGGGGGGVGVGGGGGGEGAVDENT